MKSWFKRHLQVFFYTLGQFAQNKVNILMTLLALGIGFSIPLVMYSVVDSFTDIGGEWQERPQITLYLEKDSSVEDVGVIKTQLEKDDRLEDITFISAQEGLAQFNAQNQFDEAIALLDKNPLPHVFVVYPVQISDPTRIASLVDELGKLEHVASAQYDFEWLQKLSALVDFLKRAVVVLASVISIGILLLIANTIRLEISTRRDEIDIIDQLGGSAAFISRPFIYMGFLEGLLGGAVAIIISVIVLLILSKPLLKLADLYGFTVHLPLARLDLIMIVLLLSSILGWISAKFTVHRHLRNLVAR